MHNATRDILKFDEQDQASIASLVDRYALTPAKKKEPSDKKERKNPTRAGSKHSVHSPSSGGSFVRKQTTRQPMIIK